MAVEQKEVKYIVPFFFCRLTRLGDSGFQFPTAGWLREFCNKKPKKPHMIFFYFFRLHLGKRINIIRLVSGRWVKPETFGDL